MPSTVIRSMKYDAATNTLRIFFVSGMVYNYKNVPLDIYQAIKKAESKGTYFNQNIKREFDFEKVD